MAGGNDDDGVAMYMPGYVDAVTNFAISLIFVITVLILVVLQSVLQIGSKAAQKLSNPQATSVVATVVEPQPVGPQPVEPKPAGPHPVEQKVVDQNAAAEAVERQQVELAMLKDTSSAQTKKIKQLQEQLEQAQRELKAAKNSDAAAKQAPSQDRQKQQRTETVTASQAPVTNVKQQSTVQAAQSGLRVVFNPEAVGLLAEEEKTLLEKLPAFGNISSGHWFLTVYTPKGFTEASRLAFYRVTAVRNSLIKAGVQAAQIDFKVIESTEAGANNTVVFIESKR